jgi:hypothetical protein
MFNYSDSQIHSDTFNIISGVCKVLNLHGSPEKKNFTDSTVKAFFIPIFSTSKPKIKIESLLKTITTDSTTCL